VVWSVYIPISYIKETRYREAALIDQMTAKAKLIQSADNSDFTVAATTIGALSYTLKKHKIIDMLGLTNPEIAKNPEEIKGMKSSWKERNFNSAYILHERPDYIIFSTGYKPSAPAERALFLNSQFRQNYSTICFALQKIGGLTAIWKKTGDFADSNRVMDNPEYADLFNRFFSRYSDGDYDKNAENIVRKILAMGNDDFSLPEQMLGTIFLANNNFDSAFAHYKKAMELDPANIECRLNMYMYYKTIGDITRSQLLYNEISSMAPWLLPVLNWNEK
jgi:tetratricopeptide (TPR) repeat protein